MMWMSVDELLHLDGNVSTFLFFSFSFLLLGWISSFMRSIVLLLFSSKLISFCLDFGVAGQVFEVEPWRNR